MKKLSVLILIIMCFVLTGCGEPKEKVVTTLENFKTVAMNDGFNVSDNAETYSKVDYILEANKATFGDVEIEMVKYANVEYAVKVQNSQIESFNLLKSTGAFEDTQKGNNYYKYILVSNNRYMISSRVENTLIFCKTLLDNKEAVEKIYNELGY